MYLGRYDKREHKLPSFWSLTVLPQPTFMWFANPRSIMITLGASSPNVPSIFSHAELWGYSLSNQCVSSVPNRLPLPQVSYKYHTCMYITSIKCIFLIIFHDNTLMVVRLIFGSRRNWRCCPQNSNDVLLSLYKKTNLLTSPKTNYNWHTYKITFL